MDRNFILACVLSLAVLSGWMYLTSDPARERQVGGNSPEQTQLGDSNGDLTQVTRERPSSDPSVLTDPPPSTIPVAQPDRISIAPC